MFRNLLVLTAILLSSFSLKANAASETKGLVFLMHGCKQTDEDFKKSTALEDRLKAEGYEVAYIKKQFLNFYDCWQWFYDDSFKPSSSMMKSYLQEIKDAQKKFNIPPEKTYLAGFSSGAGMALNIAMCSDNLVGAVALHAGPAFARVETVTAGLQFMTEPKHPRFKKILSPCDPTQYKGHLLSIHGHEDNLVNPGHSEMIFQDLGATKSHQRTHIKTSCDQWLADTHLINWEKGDQKLLQMIVPRLGHAWGGGDPNFKFTDKDAPSTTDAFIQFFKNL